MISFPLQYYINKEKQIINTILIIIIEILKANTHRETEMITKAYSSSFSFTFNCLFSCTFHSLTPFFLFLHSLLLSLLPASILNSHTNRLLHFPSSHQINFHLFSCSPPLSSLLLLLSFLPSFAHVKSPSLFSLPQ